MKNELSAEELALTKVVRDKWINLAFEGCKKGIDTAKFEKGIAWLYDRFLSLPAPTVVYCSSLLEAAIKITLVKDLNKELEDYTPELLADFKNKKLDPSFYKLVKDNLELKSTYIGWSNFGWVSFYDYFTQIKVLDNEDFNNYQQLIESNVYEVFEFEYAVFAVKPPVSIVYNENDLPHNTEGPSVVFEDGEMFYHVNGVSVTEELFKSLYDRKYTFEEFIKEPNEEIKSVVIAYIQSRDGDTGVYYFIKDYLKEVDTYVDKKSEEFLVGTTNGMNIGVYTLFKGEINNYNIAYVRCYCPSTDRMFFLGVHPSNNNAKDAIASLYRVPKALVNNIVSINRQGEKFSTEFDTETTRKLENKEFSEEDLKEYVSVSGDFYFEKMKYEF